MFYERRSVRLRDYDYAQEGMYYVTICTFQREHLFGMIRDDVMLLNDTGVIAEKMWKQTPTIRPNISLDAFVIMPNHIHGIIQIIRRGGMPSALVPKTRAIVTQTIGAIIRGFKSATTVQVNKMRGTPGVPIWQRNYHERIIRNQDELDHIREYIQKNPKNWADDELRVVSR